MKIKNVNLETVCGITSVLPKNTLPEIAFAGKSNVGKSSLINALMNRKSLARTSSQPGKTQTINFYNINEELYFVDLPGYGYAKVAKEEKERWGKMIENYLSKREQLAGLVLLVDIRHKADPKDIAMIEYAKSLNIPFVIVATKSDKLPSTKVATYLKNLRSDLHIHSNEILPFSSLLKKGTNELYKWIESRLIIQEVSGKIIIHDL